MMSRPLGREREFELARTHLATAGRVGALLSGDAGIGKSHLAHEVLAAVSEATGRQVWRIYARDVSADVPLAALSAHLPPDLTSDGVGPAVVLKRLLAERGKRTLVLVDDVDAIDDASQEALLVAARDGLVQLLATQRTGTLLPEPFQHALASGAVERIELAPLTDEATHQLANDLAGGALEPKTARRVIELARGNPLYVRELIAASRDSGSLIDGHAGLQIESIPAGASRLTELVSRNLSTLHDDEREALLRIAATEPVGTAELHPFVDNEVVSDLHRRGLVTIVHDQRRLLARVGHPLHREALIAAESPLRLREIRSDAAARIVELGARRREDHLKLATWALDGGRDVPVEMLISAARTAGFAGDWELSARLCEAAFRAEPSFDVGFVLQEALFEVGRYEPLEQHHRQWEATILTEANRVQFELARGLADFWRGGRESAADDLLVAALSCTSDEGRIELAAVAALMLFCAGRVVEAEAVVVELPDLPPSRALIFAAQARAHTLRAAGRPVEGLEVIEAAMRAFASLGDEVMVTSDLVLGGARLAIMAEIGDLDAVEREAAKAIARAEDAKHPSAVGLAKSSLAWARIMWGRFDDGLGVSDEAFRWLQAAEHPGMARWARCAYALGMVATGHMSEARDAIREYDSLGPHAAELFSSVMDRARAWLRLHEGFLEEAVDIVCEAAEREQRLGNLVNELACWHDLARMGRAEQAAAAVACIDTSLFEGRYLPALAQHVVALADGTEQSLTQVYEMMDDLGIVHLAAELAEALAGLSTTAASRNRWLRRAAEHQGTSGVRTSPASNVSLAPLTRREREVAVLAAQGVTSKDIAARLYVSVRTVDTHLARVYRKLGVNGRAELPKAIGRGVAC